MWEQAQRLPGGRLLKVDQIEDLPPTAIGRARSAARARLHRLRVGYRQPKNEELTDTLRAEAAFVAFHGESRSEVDAVEALRQCVARLGQLRFAQAESGDGDFALSGFDLGNCLASCAGESVAGECHHAIAPRWDCSGASQDRTTLGLRRRMGRPLINSFRSDSIDQTPFVIV